MALNIPVITSFDPKGLNDAMKKLKGLPGPLGKLGATLGAAFSVKAIEKFAMDSVHAYETIGGEVRKLMRLTGQSAEASSQLRYAAEHTGIGVEALETGIKRLSKSVVASSDTIAKFGFESRNANGAILPFNDVLGNVADKFKEMPNGIEKNALALQLFGRSGTDMLPFLNKGKDGLAELSAEATKFGVVLGQDDVDAIYKSKIAHRELHAAIQGLQIIIGRELLPILTSATKWFAEKIPEAINWTKDAIVNVEDALGSSGLGGKLEKNISLWQKLTHEADGQVSMFGKIAHATDVAAKGYENVAQKNQSLGGKLLGLINPINAVAWALDHMIPDGALAEIDAYATYTESYGHKLDLAADAARRAAVASQQAEIDAANLAKQQGGGSSNAADKLKSKIEDLRKEFDSNFADALDKATKKLQDAQGQFDDFAKSVSDSLTGTLSFSNVFDAGAETGQAFMDGLKEQAAASRAFSEKVKLLLGMGLSKSALQQVLDAGLEAGTAIADQLIAGGTDAITTSNAILSSLQDLADTVGIQASDRFYTSGVVQGSAMVAGIQSVIAKYEAIIANKKLTPKQLSKALENLQADIGVALTAPSNTAPSFAAPTDGTYAMGTPGGAVYNIEITGGFATSSEVGQAAVNAIRAFNRTNGSAQIAVSGY
jgi:hypothetical protein